MFMGSIWSLEPQISCIWEKKTVDQKMSFAVSMASPLIVTQKSLVHPVFYSAIMILFLRKFWGAIIITASTLYHKWLWIICLSTYYCFILSWSLCLWLFLKLQILHISERALQLSNWRVTQTLSPDLSGICDHADHLEYHLEQRNAEE